MTPEYDSRYTQANITLVKDLGKPDKNLQFFTEDKADNPSLDCWME
jgi:hypothetical protein